MRRITVFLCTLLLASGALPADAQEPVPVDTTAAADTATGPRMPAPVDTTYEAPSARAALIKSLIVPGWGQFSVGAHVRGAIYLTIGATSWAMLGKTIHKLNQAKDRAGAREAFVTDSLRAAMLEDPELAEELADSTVFASTVAADSLLTDDRALVDARRQQRQDWIAYTLFFTFLNGLDAYVAAHLTDFPGELDVGRRADGSISIGVTVATGRRE